MIVLIIVGLLIYSGYITWALSGYDEIDIYQEKQIIIRDEKILDLEYEIYSHQKALALKCSLSGISPVLR